MIARQAHLSFRATAFALLVAALSACASGYHDATLTGGFQEKRLSSTSWWVGFAGNGYTTAETVQSYWLYRCAEITLEQGYDGFEILTPIELTSSRAPAASAMGGRLVRIDSREEMQRYEGAMKPQLAGQIRLLRKPFEPVPARRFDAAELKNFLAPYVAGKKCGSNVCAHVHRYLYPASPS
jgi:hypothetical protein